MPNAEGYSYFVKLDQRGYRIEITPGSLGKIGSELGHLLSETRRCLVVTNTTVAPLYLDVVKESLISSGWEVSAIELPDGEKYKTIEVWQTILDALMQAKLSRHDPVIALGGGVVGDMVGFAAACYRRGIPFVQVPTTLLAQVDSSVGGKTAINHPLGKNMIGAFYQPKLVWIDPEVLHTLSERELAAGISELIKYGLIRDAEFFNYLEERTNQLLNLDGDVITKVIHTSCKHKAEVVMRDETEQGERALLNLGHTFGHAIESITKYTEYLHGEAVALGTIMAARLSCQLGHAPEDTEERICNLYRQYGLPTEIPSFATEQWLDVMGHDKKNVGSRIRYILLRGIGDAFIAEDVGNEAIATLIDSFR